MSRLCEKLWLKGLGTSQSEFAERLSQISPTDVSKSAMLTKLNEVVSGRRAMSAIYAVVIGLLLETSPRMWLGIGSCMTQKRIPPDLDLPGLNWSKSHVSIGPPERSPRWQQARQGPGRTCNQLPSLKQRWVFLNHTNPHKNLGLLTQKIMELSPKVPSRRAFDGRNPCSFANIEFFFRGVGVQLV